MLDELGVEKRRLSAQDPFLKVSDYMETSVEDVYAIGDITSPPERHYSHLASEAGLMAAEYTEIGGNRGQVLY